MPRSQYHSTLGSTLRPYRRRRRKRVGDTRYKGSRRARDLGVVFEGEFGVVHVHQHVRHPLVTRRLKCTLSAPRDRATPRYQGLRTLSEPRADQYRTSHGEQADAVECYARTGHGVARA
eukprot:585619-Rhodomonas_salina.1